MSPLDRALVAKAHRTLEPAHAFIYFSQIAGARYSELGVTAARMQYFASRGAVFGACGPEIVIATFYNFAPHQARRALPAAWQLASPADLIAARLAAADEELGARAAEALPGGALAEAVTLARTACEGLESPGRPLYAAYAELAWPEPLHLQLFQAITLLREWRGDGHIALLVGGDLPPVEALILHAACGGPDEGVLKLTRGWGDEQWEAGRGRLVARELLAADGRTPTAQGSALRAAIEDATDELDLRAWSALAADQVERLRSLVRPLSVALAPMMAIMASKSLPAEE